MRKTVVLVALSAAVVGLAARTSAAAPATHTTRAAAATVCSNKAIQPYLFKTGELTVATDSPAYDPWFVNNTPSNGKGYESAVAYAVAKLLGFAKLGREMGRRALRRLFRPGPEALRLRHQRDLLHRRAGHGRVLQSISYYAVNQALVAMKKSAIVKHHSPAELRTYVYGDQIGSTSLSLHLRRAASDAPAVGLQHLERRQVGPPRRPHPGPRGRHADGAVHQLLGDPRTRSSSASSRARGSTTGCSSPRATSSSAVSTRRSRR